MAKLTKLVYCVRKRDDLTTEEFRRYWLDEHGPLVRSLRENGALPGMVRYVQSHTDFDASAGPSTRCGQAPYDGITEVWMDPSRVSDDDASRRAAAEAGRQLLEDEAKFIDFAKSSVFITTEHVIFD